MRDITGVFESPTILRRYVSTFIDGMFIMSVFIFASVSIYSESASADYARITVFLAMVLIYEPVFTSRLCTLGQKLTGIRVRTIDSCEKISVPAAYIRIIVKVLLGIISLLTITLTKDRRAVHDFASGSVVIMK